MEDLIEKMVRELKTEVGDGKAIIGLSGGIDSSVATALAARALGNKLTAVFVDHGFMREGEPEEVRTLSKTSNSTSSPPTPRKGSWRNSWTSLTLRRNARSSATEFVRVFEEIAEKSGAEYLIQGTIYPDRIESGFRRNSDKIKTHHNVAGLPSKIKFKKILEPLRDLYKDEVRRVAKMLELPDAIVSAAAVSRTRISSQDNRRIDARKSQTSQRKQTRLSGKKSRRTACRRSSGSTSQS